MGKNRPPPEHSETGRGERDFDPTILWNGERRNNFLCDGRQNEEITAISG